MIIIMIIVMISIHYNIITGFVKLLFWKTKYLKNNNFTVIVEGIT